MSDTAVLNARFYRPNTEGDIQHINFMFIHGGLGDYIGYLTSIEWIARTQPQIKGYLYLPDFFIPIAKNVLKNYLDRWYIGTRLEMTSKEVLKRPTCAPYKNITRVGMNAVELGYVYFMAMNPAPEDGYYYTKLDLSEVPLWGQVGHSPYAVMTPYSTNKNRTMTAQAFNGVKNYLLEKGITPVFVGKKDFVINRKNIDLAEGYDFTGGVDLSGKTNLLEAAKLMSHAKMVIGIDNGLLHLAAMTDVPIIFGFTMASPEHAEPRRKDNPVYRIFPDVTSLPCTFCQSQMRFFRKTVDFTTCVYEDNLCTKVIGEPKDWTVLIDRVLRHG